MAARGRTVISDFDLKHPGVKVGYIGCFAMAAALAVFMIHPLIWVFMGALKMPKEVYEIPPRLLPDQANWINLVTAWKAFSFPRFTFNTLMLFAGIVLFKFPITCMAAYAFSFLRLPARRWLLLAFMVTLMVPGMAYMIPSYLILYRLPIFGLNLLNTYWAFWLPAGADAFAIILLKGFFDGMPGEMLEAARIDGASETKILRRVVLPLAKPILATLFILNFMGVWRDFLWPYIVLRDSSRWTIMIALYTYVFQSQILTPNIQLAGMMLATIPPIAIFLLFQRYILAGVTFSGIIKQ